VSRDGGTGIRGVTVSESQEPALDISAAEAPRDPEELEAFAREERAELSAGTRLGAVHLTVGELARSVEYYRRVVGLEVLRREDGEAVLGAGQRELVALAETPGARPSFGHTGLYHLALLLPERVDLARWLAHAARSRIPLVGLSDHFVSEAIYLSDPDGHGIEIYWDRPREVWEGKVGERMTTLPLDVDSLISEVDDPATEPFDGLPDETVMGHVHLKVSAIPETVAFYRDVLGFAVMARLGSHAAFLSAGGYHHHIGANTWESAGTGPPPPGSAALRFATVVLEDRAELERVAGRVGDGEATGDGVLVRDPSGNALLLTSAA
jgi:catechol 2,3-dioxygenase